MTHTDSPVRSPLTGRGVIRVHLERGMYDQLSQLAERLHCSLSTLCAEIVTCYLVERRGKRFQRDESQYTARSGDHWEEVKG